MSSRLAVAVVSLSVLASSGCSGPASEDARPGRPRAYTRNGQPPPRDHEASERDGYGEVMAGVGRRFELVGKAAQAGRYELAAYQAREIGEYFDDVLPKAKPPADGHPEVLEPLVGAFGKANLPELQQAIETHDQTQIATAFRKTADACNACHQSSGHGYIEVPTVPGRSVPNVDPIGSITPAASR